MPARRGARCLAAAFLLPMVGGCAVVDALRSPHLRFPYYYLTFAETRAAIDDRSAESDSTAGVPGIGEWRLAVLKATMRARRGDIAPEEIPGHVLADLGGDADAAPRLGDPVCTARAVLEQTGVERDPAGGIAVHAALRSGCCADAVRPTRIELVVRDGGPSEARAATAFRVTVGGVDWTTWQLGNQVRVTSRAGGAGISGSFWFVAAEQTDAGWIDRLDRVLIAPAGTFVLDRVR